MPFCSVCGLFFAKGNVCSCVSGRTPAEAAISPRVAESKTVVVQAAPIPVPKPKTQVAVAAPPRAVERAAPKAGSSEVVAETSSATSKYCASCSEPKTLCKCVKDEGEPFYGARAANPVVAASVSYCGVCNEPRGLCTCKAAQSATSPRQHSKPSNVAQAQAR